MCLSVDGEKELKRNGCKNNQKASVRGGWLGHRGAVLPRNLLMCPIQRCDPCSAWGNLCAYGRAGHAVGFALGLSDAPFNLKLATTVARVLPIPCVLFACYVLHLPLGLCLSLLDALLAPLVRTCRCNTQPKRLQNYMRINLLKNCNTGCKTTYVQYQHQYFYG